MKLKDGFVLRDVAGETVVLPVGGAMDLDMMITLNGTGRFLWERMDRDVSAEALTQALLGEYDVDAATARASVDAFAARLKELDLLA